MTIDSRWRRVGPVFLGLAITAGVLGRRPSRPLNVFDSMAAHDASRILVVRLGGPVLVRRIELLPDTVVFYVESEEAGRSVAWTFQGGIMMGPVVRRAPDGQAFDLGSFRLDLVPTAVDAAMSRLLPPSEVLGGFVWRPQAAKARLRLIIRSGSRRGWLELDTMGRVLSQSWVTLPSEPHREEAAQVLSPSAAGTVILGTAQIATGAVGVSETPENYLDRERPGVVLAATPDQSRVDRATQQQEDR